MSRPVDLLSPPVDFMSGPVDFRAHPVDFMSVLSANALSLTLDVTHDPRSRYGKIARNRSAICDRKVAF